MFLGVALGATTLGFIFLAWPKYRRATDMNRQIETVKMRVANERAELQMLESVARELKAIKESVERDLRRIPDSTDMATLITALTVPADGYTVLDQTFNRGRVRAIPTVEDGSLYSLPLIIEMTATFDRVYALIEAVEQIPDLVRVTSVRVERHPKHENMIQATINLDAVFEVDT